jgi:uncharacterized Zn finger protein
MEETATYVCDSCGEDVTVPVEYLSGGRQEFVEDCPVCCRPHLIRVEIDEDGSVRITAVSE